MTTNNRMELMAAARAQGALRGRDYDGLRVREARHYDLGQELAAQALVEEESGGPQCGFMDRAGRVGPGPSHYLVVDEGPCGARGQQSL